MIDLIRDNDPFLDLPIGRIVKNQNRLIDPLRSLMIFRVAHGHIARFNPPNDSQLRILGPRDSLYVKIKAILGRPIPDLDGPNPLPLLIPCAGGHQNILLTEQSPVGSPDNLALVQSRHGDLGRVVFAS